MKILLLSDTHSNVKDAVSLIRRQSGLDMFFHLGDTYQDAVKIHEETGLAMKAVSGNMDGKKVGPPFEIFSLGGVRFLLTHGDRFYVNGDRHVLYREALKQGAKVACYGHTHIARDETIRGIRLINPGALKGRTKSYAVMTIDDGEISLIIEKL